MASAGKDTASLGNAILVKSYVLRGMSPSTFSRSRSSGTGDPGGAVGSISLTLPEPSIAPSTENGHRSRAQIFSISGNDSGEMSIAEFSWYSAPQISKTDRVASPSFTSRISSVPPLG